AKKGPRWLAVETGRARARSSLGRVLEATGRLEAAEQAYREALKLQAEGAARFPNVTVVRKELGTTYAALGDLLLRARRLPEAETAYREALTVRQQLIADFPARFTRA